MPISLFFPKMHNVCVKSEYEHCGISPIVTWYAISFLETMLINTPNLGYEMVVTPTK